MYVRRTLCVCVRRTLCVSLYVYVSVYQYKYITSNYEFNSLRVCIKYLSISFGCIRSIYYFNYYINTIRQICIYVYLYTSINLSKNTYMYIKLIKKLINL